MADIRPFKGIRYSSSAIPDLSQVVAPPYDVISPEQQDALCRRSRWNIVHLILNKPEPGDDERENQYTRAAVNLSSWLEEGVLVKDREDSIYVCDQEFDADGRRYRRRAFIARVRLEELDKGQIFGHEETMPGPKEDRLRLMEACRANLSQVFAIYEDGDGAVESLLSSAVRGAPDAIADDDGVRNLLWKVSESSALDTLRAAMSGRKLYIADGHHRYETALKYRDMQEGEGPWSFVMMACVSMSDPGLVILPTHRVVRGVGRGKVARLVEKAREDFEIEQAPDIGRLLRGMEEAADKHVLGAVLDGRCWLLRLRSEDAVKVSGRSTAWRRLDVVILHSLILEKILGIDFKGVKHDPRLKYVKSASEAGELVCSGEFEAAFLLRATKMSEVKAVAENGEKMPPKSTYFYPKLTSGLVINDLLREV